MSKKFIDETLDKPYAQKMDLVTRHQNTNKWSQGLTSSPCVD